MAFRSEWEIPGFPVITEAGPDAIVEKGVLAVAGPYLTADVLTPDIYALAQPTQHSYGVWVGGRVFRRLEYSGAYVASDGVYMGALPDSARIFFRYPVLRVQALYVGPVKYTRDGDIFRSDTTIHTYTSALSGAKGQSTSVLYTSGGASLGLTPAPLVLADPVAARRPFADLPALR